VRPCLAGLRLPDHHKGVGQDSAANWNRKPDENYYSKNSYFMNFLNLTIKLQA